jgi:acetoin utilization protein AcuB
MKVRDIMSTNVITISDKTLVNDAKKIMKAYNIRRLPVTKRDKLVGLVTEHMMLKAEPSPATSLSIHELRYILDKITVKEIMVKNPFAVSPNMPVEEALRLGEEKRHGAFPVVENRRLVGIITESDIVKLVSKIVKVQDRVKGTDIMADKEFGNRENGTEIQDENKTIPLSLVTLQKTEEDDRDKELGLESDIIGHIAKKITASGIDVRCIG